MWDWMRGWLDGRDATPAAAVPAPPLEEPSDRLPRPGDVLEERYEIVSMLGKGGAGAVFRGVDRMLGFDVAIKMLTADGFMGAGASPIDADLRSEAVAAMRLAHPLIARVYHYERRRGVEYLVMEYVPGNNLFEIARDRGAAFSVDEALQIGIDVCDALAYAHSEGVIHNDIKPRNILRDARGMTKVCDFGLARRAGCHETDSGRAIAGTAAYICPERIRGEPVDARGDLYSLGATLYALVHGAPPFGSRSNEALRGHVRSEVPRSPHIPDALEAVLRRALAKRPEERFGSAEDMAHALSAVQRARGMVKSHLRSQEPKAVPVPAPVPAPAPAPAPAAKPAAPQPLPPGMARLAPRRVSDHGQEVELAAFDLDIHPVTNADYARFVAATHEPPPDWWVGRAPPADKADHPVTGVSLAEARAYAAWAGKRLPTSLEWLAALRGEENRRMPWGDACRPEECNCPRTSGADTAAVGVRAGNATPEGVRDLLGNVWEWTEVVPGAAPEEQGYHYVFGGSFRHQCGADGDEPPRTVVNAHAAYRYLGFRCARSVEEGR